MGSESTQRCSKWRCVYFQTKTIRERMRGGEGGWKGMMLRQADAFSAFLLSPSRAPSAACSAVSKKTWSWLPWRWSRGKQTELIPRGKDTLAASLPSGCDSDSQTTADVYTHFICCTRRQRSDHSFLILRGAEKRFAWFNLARLLHSLMHSSCFKSAQKWQVD